MSSSKKTGSVFKTLLWFIALLVLGFMLFASVSTIRAMFAAEDDSSFVIDLLGSDSEEVTTNTNRTVVNTTQADEEDAVEDSIEGSEAVFSLPGLTPEEVITGSEETTYRYSPDNSISLAPTDNAELMKHGMGATTDETVLISGVEAIQSTGYSAKDGSKTVVLVIPVGDTNQEVLFVRGTESFLATVEAELVLNTQ